MFKTEDGKFEPGSVVISCAIGGAVGLVLTLLLLFLFAALISGGQIDERYSEPVVILSALAGAAAGGAIAAKREKKSVLPVGAAAGAVFFLLILILSALGTYGSVFGIMTTKLVICGLAGGVLGGTLCLGRGKRRKGRRTR